MTFASFSIACPRTLTRGHRRNTDEIRPRLLANPATATFWLLYEMTRDPDLHSPILHFIDSATFPLPLSYCGSSAQRQESHDQSAQPSGILPSILTDSPLLQSMYMETLRLRVSVLIILSADFGNFHLNEWMLPKDKLILISRRIVHVTHTTPYSMHSNFYLLRDSFPPELSSPRPIGKRKYHSTCGRWSSFSGRACCR